MRWQLTIDDRTAGAAAQKLPAESVVKVTGRVMRRPEKMINAAMPTGGIEVAVSNCELLNSAARVPFPPDAADDNIANDAIRQRYRCVFVCV